MSSPGEMAYMNSIACSLAALIKVMSCSTRYKGKDSKNQAITTYLKASFRFYTYYSALKTELCKDALLVVTCFLN